MIRKAQLQTITENQIHLWFCYDETITEPTLLTRYHELLNPEETKQQARFHFAKHRHQYLITRAMVRSVLSLYESQIAPQDWRFIKNEYGRPSIENTSLNLPLSFNLSHCEQLVVMAVSLVEEVGVDVEYLPRSGNPIEIADRFFSKSELEQLYQLPEGERVNRFFDLWTLKEAYIKACGMGLSIPLDHFSYYFDEQKQIDIRFVEQRNDFSKLWNFWQVNPAISQKMSLALKTSVPMQVDDISVSMRKIIPQENIEQVFYPISKGQLISDG